MATGTTVELPQGRARTPLIVLLTADGISQTGSMLTVLAIPWFVLETTGSAARTGLAAAASALAVVIAGALGGAVVDRIGPKRASIASEVAGGAAVALIPLLHQTVGLVFWQLLGLVFLGALVRAPGWAARQSLYAEVARLGDVGLERTNATGMMVGRAAGLAGPLLGGVLIAAISAASVLWVDAATFLISAGLVTVGVPARARSTIYPREQPSATSASRFASYFREVRDGFRFIRGDGLIATLILVFTLESLLAEPLWTVVFPVYATEVFGSAVDLGVLFGALAFGSLLGNTAFFVWGPRLPRRWTFVVGFTMRVANFWVLVAMPPLGVIIVSVAIAALFLEPHNPMWVTIVQERVAEAMRGRVLGVYLALSYAARSLGVLIYGVLLDGIGLRSTLVVMASANAIVPIILLLAPALRTIAAPGGRGAHARPIG